MQILRETRDARYMYQNELEKVYFKHDIAHGANWDLPRRIPFDKVFCDMGFAITGNWKYGNYIWQIA